MRVWCCCLLARPVLPCPPCALRAGECYWERCTCRASVRIASAWLAACCFIPVHCATRRRSITAAFPPLLPPPLPPLLQWARPISDNLSFCVTLSTGLMLPYGPGASRRSTSITDRFFLGGPSNLRGFQLCGAGPSDERRPRRATGEPGAAPGETPRGGGASSGGRDALGGDLYASLMAALNFKLPHPALQALRLHGHAFLNGGSSVLLTGNGKGYGANLREFGTSLRWSVGAGLVLPTPFGRFEINYAWVLSHQPYDRLQAGIQLGFASSPFSALG